MLEKASMTGLYRTRPANWTCSWLMLRVRGLGILAPASGVHRSPTPRRVRVAWRFRLELVAVVKWGDWSQRLVTTRVRRFRLVLVVVVKKAHYPYPLYGGGREKMCFRMSRPVLNPEKLPPVPECCGVDTAHCTELASANYQIEQEIHTHHHVFFVFFISNGKIQM